MRYVATRRYRSDYCRAFQTGPLERGTVVDISEAAAAAFNADSPGVLVPEAVVAPVDDKPAAELRDVDAPPADRAVRRPYRRRTGEG